MQSSIKDKIGVGKYKGKTILKIAKLDPEYLSWVLKSSRILGPLFRDGTPYIFPFKEMEKHGFFPPPSVITAYFERGEHDELIILQEEEWEQQEYEMDSFNREVEDEFNEEMGSVGWWNID